MRAALRQAAYLSLFAACASAQTQVTLSTAISPTAGQAGITSITLTGSNFPAGTIQPASVTVSMSPAAGGTAATTTATTVTTVTGSTRRVAFIVPGTIIASVPTSYLVSVSGATTTGTAFVSANKVSLTVDPPPAITSINPNSAQINQTVQVAIASTYTNFVQGATFASFGAGMVVNGSPLGGAAPITVTSPTTATVQIQVSSAATAGPRSVTVYTGLQQATLANGFTVLGPTLLTVSPNSGQQGQQNLAVTITGQLTHFQQGVSQASFGAGITVVSLTANSVTSATAILNIDPAAAIGTRNVTVTTGTEVATLTSAFTVTSAVTGITAAPSTWNFGNVPVATSSQKTFTLTPSGAGSLTVNSITIAGAYFTLGNLPSLPLVVPSSGTSFTVTYSPVGTIASTATITINSNAATSPTLISLSGTGIPTLPPPAGSITVATDQAVYRRLQPVQISGALTASGGAGIPNIPVSLQVSINGTTRTFTPYTNAQGIYQTTFQPGTTDGGMFSLTATASSDSVTQTANTTFRIFGLYINPASLSQDLLVGGAVAVPLDLQNIGDATLSRITYSATVTPASLIAATFPQSAVTLSAGALATIPVVLTAPAGNPPSAPVTVLVTITATDSVSNAADPEISTFTVTLRPAVSTLTLTPPSLNIGVNPGGSVTGNFAVSNQGFAPTNNSAVTLVDPVTFNWVSLGNANPGNLAAGATSQFQVIMNPPSTLAVGTYAVLFNVSGGTNPLQGTVNVNVTQSTLGAVAFTVNDDTGTQVGGATITLIGVTNQKTFQGVTAANGTATLSGVDAGNYTYVVAAPFHDPGSGAVTVTANTTAQVSVILTYDVVSFTFTVTPTTISTQYNVTLNILYSTTLPKPALMVVPFQLQYSFFPEDFANGQAPCSLQITNTHPTANVFNTVIDATQLDAGLPNGVRIHIQFADGTSLYQVGTLPGKGTTTVACHATLDGDNVPTHNAGNVVVQGNYYYSLNGQILIGTTTTPVPVTYTRPPELEYSPITFTYDQTNPSSPVLTYTGGGFVYTVRSERAGKTFTISQPPGPPFGGQNLAAFTQTAGALASLDVINANQANGFWQTNFNLQKQILLNSGDTTTYDISTLNNGQTLFQAVQAQLAANPTQMLTLPSYLAFEGQWSDRATPTGYLIPIQITTITPAGGLLTQLPWTFSNETGPALTCLNLSDPSCNLLNTLPATPPSPAGNNNGQIAIAIDQKIRLERQAFNVSLGIAAQAVLTNVVPSVQILNANASNAASNFFILLTGDPQGATTGGTVSSAANVSWQLIPNVGAGGTSPQGTQYTVQATVTYKVNGIAYTATTQAVTITVLPSPQLTVAYSVPFVEMAGKTAKVRVTIQNIGYGTANNLTILSMQPRIVSTTNPNLIVGFNITGSSNTADSSGYLPGNLTINFGNVAPGATVSGYWTMQVTQNGFFIDLSSTFSQVDYQGIQLDPQVLPPTTKLIPAIGGYVTSNTGQIIPNMTVALTLNGAAAGSDVTDSNGVFYIPDLTAGPSGTYYLATITDSFGTVWLTKTIGVLGDQGTSLITFVIAGINAQPITITSSPSGQPFTFGGNNYTTPQTLQGFAGSTYTINFGSGIRTGIGTRFAISGWSDGATSNPRIITVGTSPATYTANFQTQYLLTTGVLPAGSGNLTAVPASPDGYYASGTQVQLAAAAAKGYKFTGFSGATLATSSPQTVSMNTPETVVANFAAPIDQVAASSLGIATSTPTTVTVTARITDPSLIAGSVDLLRLNGPGGQPIALGIMHDDGQNGDLIANDQYYTLQVTFNEPVPTTIQLEVSAALRGQLLRKISGNLNLNVTLPTGLPPDPGAAGSSTLQGIDSDGDGVRDDIERYIALAYPESPAMRAALTQIAVATQAVILDAANQQQSISNIAALGNSIISAVGALGSQVANPAMADLRNQILNTLPRAEAYLMADTWFSGQLYTIPSQAQQNYLAGAKPLPAASPKSRAVPQGLPPRQQSSGNCQTGGATIFFGNGVDNTFADGLANAMLVQADMSQRIEQTNSFDPNCLVYGLAYDSIFSSGDTVLGTIWDIIGQVLGVANLQLTAQLVSQITAWLAQLSTAPAAVQQAVSNAFQTLTYVFQDDLMRQVNLYQLEMAAGNKVIVVAHSQGNYYVNQAYSYLFPTPAASGSPPFSVVAVATPANFVPGNGPYTTLTRDLIQVVPGALPGNTDNGACGSPLACHSFAGSYMTGTNSRERILDGIEDALPIVIGVSKLGDGTGTVTSPSSIYTPSGIDCDTGCPSYMAAFEPGNVTISETPGPGSVFAGWSGDCQALGTTGQSLGGGSSITFPALVDLSGSVIASYPEHCTAEFDVIKVRLSPSGSYNFASTPGPYNVEVVDANGNAATQHQAITVNLTRQVLSVCDVLLNPVTVVIPNGSSSGPIGFVATEPFCNGSFFPAITKWDIDSVFTADGSRVATVAGQTILEISR